MAEAVDINALDALAAQQNTKGREGTAGGDDVVDQGNVAWKPCIVQGKGVVQVVAALGLGQQALVGGMANPANGPGEALAAECVSERLGDQGTLVEASAEVSQGMERYREQDRGRCGDLGGQRQGQRFGEPEVAAEFELADQLVEREAVFAEPVEALPRRGIAKAGAAIGGCVVMGCPAVLAVGELGKPGPAVWAPVVVRRRGRQLAELAAVRLAQKVGDGGEWR